MGLYSKRFNIKTNKTKNEVISALKSNVGEKNTFLKHNKSVKSFNGIVKDNEFSIIPKIKYRNTGLPVINGRIIEMERGVLVEVKMHVAISFKIGVAFWYLITGLGAIFSLINSLSKELSVWLAVLFFFGLILSVFLFRAEVPNREKQLLDIFDGEIIIKNTNK